jgi:DUF1365 family protein
MTWLYSGRVHHARFGPKRHRLSYRIFMLLADVDTLSAARTRGILSLNRSGLLSLHTSDYGDGSGGTLRQQVERLIAGHGLNVPGGAIRLLTMPRVLRRAFNPLSVYYCHDLAGELAVMVYEVSNTFGARHHYVVPASRQRCAKAFFVSPFMDQDLAYAFDVAAPGETAHIGIRVHRGDTTVLTAGFQGHGRPATDVVLLRAWLTHPWQTIGVLAAIYLEGAKLLLSGFRWRSPHSVETPAKLELHV